MAYNISNLPQYTDQQSRTFVTKSILEADTIKLLADNGSFDPTAKGNQAIQLIDTDVFIQDDSACGRNSNGGATLSQATLSVKPLKVNTDYCVKILASTYAVEDMKAKMKGVIYDDALFLDTIGELNSGKVSVEIEKMIWNGDISITGVTNLNKIDGFLKSIKSGSTYIQLSGVTTGATVTSRLRAANAAMPIEVSNKTDYRLFIGQDTYAKYLSEMADGNYFAGVSGVDPFTLWGTIVKLQPVSGLNGTNVIVASRLRNLRAGGEMTDASFEKYYSRETELVYFDTHFSIGAVAVYPQEIGLGKAA